MNTGCLADLCARRRPWAHHVYLAWLECLKRRWPDLVSPAARPAYMQVRYSKTGVSDSYDQTTHAAVADSWIYAYFVISLIGAHESQSEAYLNSRTCLIYTCFRVYSHWAWILVAQLPNLFTCHYLMYTVKLPYQDGVASLAADPSNKNIDI